MGNQNISRQQTKSLMWVCSLYTCFITLSQIWRLCHASQFKICWHVSGGSQEISGEKERNRRLICHRGLTVLQRHTGNTHIDFQKWWRWFILVQIYTIYVCMYQHTQKECLYIHTCELCLKMRFFRYYTYTFACQYMKMCCKTLLAKPSPSQSPVLSLSASRWLYPSDHKVQLCL